MKNKPNPDASVFLEAAESAIECGAGFQLVYGKIGDLYNELMGITDNSDPYMSQEKVTYQEKSEQKCFSFLLCLAMLNNP